MDLVEKIEKELQAKYGEFNTNLEIEYKRKLTDNLINGNTKDKLFWVTYNQVVIELKKTFSDSNKLREMLYMLTEPEINQESCLGVIESLINESKELSRLYDKIKNF